MDKHNIIKLDSGDYVVCSCGSYDGTVWNYMNHVREAVGNDR